MLDVVWVLQWFPW